MEWLSETFAFSIPVLDSIPAIRAILGFVLVFFLPGFAWTLVFFQGRQINIIERLALSFGLSIALVVLSIIALNLVIGVRITASNSLLIIVAVTVVPLIYYGLRRIMDRQGGKEAE